MEGGEFWRGRVDGRGSTAPGAESAFFQFCSGMHSEWLVDFIRECVARSRIVTMDVCAVQL